MELLLEEEEEEKVVGMCVERCVRVDEELLTVVLESKLERISIF
jgi:hypothetical protein